ncbi:MAG: CopG family ribbon-helix-helix protein [Bryobacteraceae bacterium]
MTETLSIRIDAATKKRLDKLSKRSRRSKSFLAGEAINAYVESEEWQLGELQAGFAELESGQEVAHGGRFAIWFTCESTSRKALSRTQLRTGRSSTAAPWGR